LETYLANVLQDMPTRDDSALSESGQQQMMQVQILPRPDLSLLDIFLSRLKILK